LNFVIAVLIVEKGGTVLGKIMKSLQLRHVDAGSCNACEQELTALLSKDYDVSRYGIEFVASPRHADALIVTGSVSDTMKPALVRVFEAVPKPKGLIVIGDCALGCGIDRHAYASHGGVQHIVQSDLSVPGCPPSPQEIVNRLKDYMRGNSTV
jgi:Ni,Fe-hydrogenase III small subunit